MDRFDPPLGHLSSNGTLTCRAVKNAVLGAMLYHIIYVPFLDIMGQVISKGHAENPAAAEGVIILIFPLNEIHADKFHDIRYKMVLDRKSVV